MKAPRLDLWADLNTEDDNRLCWSALRHATKPEAVVPGAVLIAGTETLWAVVRIESIDDDGMVHFSVVDPQDPVSKAVLADASPG
ncbi:MAG: hypothetical protein JJLCMIEE_00689 [Acidimicrobiales bacterium]|nr:MAG: hypothetical protein EDR02_02460 [Actinomycetota bacterium]MBV6507639.1 hypothetical protein [Acidimicrobiales bacterium]RIK07570.1 MAG: hypothetical protein DCC48_03470 [Acidobacteriota bacterium]